MTNSINTDIDLEHIKSVLGYCPLTGYLFWIRKVKKSNAVVGKRAGSIKKRKGYIQLAIKRRNYSAHRIAFMLYHNRVSHLHIDHINGVRHDNRIENLREVTISGNSMNMDCHRDGHPYGTNKHKYSSSIMYSAHIGKVYLGIYSCKWQAAMAAAMFDNYETVFGKNKNQYDTTRRKRYVLKPKEFIDGN